MPVQIGAVAAPLGVIAVIAIAASGGSGTSDQGYHPSDQRSYDLGYQAGGPSGYAGREVAQDGVSGYQACVNAQHAALIFADDPLLAGSMAGQNGSPANPDDYLQGCQAAVGTPGGTVG
jgi:hypothetical protein